MEEEVEEGLANPTPAMRELLNKRKSLGKQPASKGAAKSPSKKVVKAPEPDPRLEFVGR